MTLPDPATPLSTVGSTLSPLATVLAGAVRAHRTQKVPLTVVWDAAVGHNRALASSADGRAELAAALDELAVAGLVTFPKDRAAYDRRSSPALPLVVRRPARVTTPRPAAPVKVWPSALQAAAALATRPDEYALLEVVAEFLRSGAAQRRSVPQRERSLELFGDEKRLDALLASRLFRSGALTLDLLRCRSVPMPFASQWVPGRDAGEVVLLVVENHHTYASLLTATRELAAAGGPARHIGYGAGGQFCTAVGSVVLLEPLPTRIVYFGDLDLRGLQIPATADVAARAAKLPPVQPAVGLYQALLAHGTVVPNPQDSAASAHVAAAWLGPLAEAAARILTAGGRVPQEAVGLELLSAQPALVRDL